MSNRVAHPKKLCTCNYHIKNRVAKIFQPVVRKFQRMEFVDESNFDYVIMQWNFCFAQITSTVSFIALMV